MRGIAPHWLLLKWSGFRVISTKGRTPARCAIFNTDKSCVFSLKKKAQIVLRHVSRKQPVPNIKDFSRASLVRNGKIVAWQWVVEFCPTSKNLQSVTVLNILPIKAFFRHDEACHKAG
jgi:hypothetical protein